MSFDEERHEQDAAVTTTERSTLPRADRAGSGDRIRSAGRRREDRKERAAGDWREVDRQLRRIARRRAAIDAEEAPWLLAAYRGAVHVELGHATFVEYIERVLGHGPRVAIDRLRVAEVLERLPATRAALAAGDAAYSAVRELTRVATPMTEGAWLAAAAGKTVREVEEMVSGHRPGDLPDDPTDPDLRPRVLRFEIRPETFALFCEAERRLAMELGHMLSDDELIAALSQAALSQAGLSQAALSQAGLSQAALSQTALSQAALSQAALSQAGLSQAGLSQAALSQAAPLPTWAPQNDANASADARLAEMGAATSAAVEDAVGAPEREGAVRLAAIEGPTRGPVETQAAVVAVAASVGSVPRYQVAVTVCSECRRGWQDGAGRAIEIGQEAIATALCDAQMIGDVNTPSASKRATRTIPPATRRQVLRRDHRRCVVPGCRRSIQWIDIHHLVRRADGGGHDASNLVATCAQHHRQAHQGRLVITGQAGALKFHHADGRPWGAAPLDRRDEPVAVTADGRSPRAGGDDAVRVPADEDAVRVPADEDRQREALVRDALRKLGWSAGEAASATVRARAHVDAGAPIEAWIVAALRACRKSGA